MYILLKNLHSGVRNLLFVFVLFAIIQSLIGWLGGKPYTGINKRINLYVLIGAHTQLLIGIILYFLSPYVQFNSTTMKDPVTRYFTVEHWVMMLIAIALITVGYIKSKKGVLPEARHRTVAIYYAIAFLIIIGAIIAGHLPVLGSRA